MLPSKLAMLLNGIHLSCYTALLNAFLISVEFSKFQVGIIIGIMYAPPIVAGPLWGYIADRTRKPKLVIATLCIGACIFIVPLPWIAHTINPVLNKYNKNCNSNGTTNIVNSSNGGNEICDENQIDNEHDKDGMSSLFVVLLTLITLGSMFLVPILGYINTLVMNVVKSTKGNISFGGQSILISPGIALGNFIADKAADNYVLDLSPYTPVFLILLSALLPLLPIAFILIDQDKADEEADQQAGLENVHNDIVKMVLPVHKQVLNHLQQPDVIVFIITVFVSGIGNYVFLNFIYSLVDDASKSKSEMTYIIITAMLIEVPFYPFASRVIRLVHGTIPALIISMFANFIRYLVMSFDVHFNVLVTIQILNAISFSLTLVAIMQHTHTISPKAINMTMNGIVLTVFTPLSSLFVGFVGGKLLDEYGGRKLFFGVSLICVAWTLVMIAYYGGKKLKVVCIYDINKIEDQVTVNEIGIDGPMDLDDIKRGSLN